MSYFQTETKNTKKVKMGKGGSSGGKGGKAGGPAYAAGRPGGRSYGMGLAGRAASPLYAGRVTGMGKSPLYAGKGQNRIGYSAYQVPGKGDGYKGSLKTSYEKAAAEIGKMFDPYRQSNSSKKKGMDKYRNALSYMGLPIVGNDDKKPSDGLGKNEQPGKCALCDNPAMGGSMLCFSHLNTGSTTYSMN